MVARRLEGVGGQIVCGITARFADKPIERSSKVPTKKKRERAALIMWVIVVTNYERWRGGGAVS